MKRTAACKGNVMYFVYAAAVVLIGYALWGYVNIYTPISLSLPEQSFETHSFFKSPIEPHQMEQPRQTDPSAQRWAGTDIAAVDQQNRQNSIEHSRISELTTRPLFNTPSYNFREDSSPR